MSPGNQRDDDSRNGKSCPTTNTKITDRLRIIKVIRKARYFIQLQKYYINQCNTIAKTTI